ncbi:MAG: hypothetical protein SynsKO_12460 [Synoicihabitans sp.]
MLSIATSVYLVAAVSWFFVLNQRPYNYVTLVDCVLAPIRWDEIRRKRGDAYIDEGLASLQERKWSDALHQIRAGLARSPDNWKGRQNLALFLVAAGRTDQGIDLLIEGFELRYQGREAMELLVKLCMQGEAIDPLLGALDQSIAHTSPAAVRDRDWLIDQKCRVLMLANRHADTLAWVDEQEGMTEVRHESRVVALIELGQFDEAKEALTAWAKGSGALGGVRRLEVRLARERGDLAAMREALAQMRDSSPTLPEPWIYSIVQEFLAGEPEAANEAMSRYLLRFDGNVDSLVATAVPLQQIRAWELLDRLLAHIDSKGIQNSDIERVRIEAAIKRKRYARAAELIAELETLISEPTAGDQRWFEVVEAWTADLQTGSKATREALITTLRNHPVNLSFLRDIATESENLGRENTALAIWDLASALFGMNPGPMTEANRLRKIVGDEVTVAEIELPSIEDGAELDLESVLPPAPEIDAELAAILRSPVRFQRVAQKHLDEENWPALDSLIREVRRANPSWAQRESSFISMTEIELNIHNQNWPALVTNVRLSLDGSTEAALSAAKIVRRLDGMGERDVAELILVEIERRYDGFHLARQIREDWQAEEMAEQENVPSE